MSAATVRSAIATFLQPPAITGLEAVYLDQPWFVTGGAWQLTQNLGWGAIGWVHLDEESETRVTVPAISGSKDVTYRVGLVVLYQYLIPSQLPAGAQEDVWVTYLDQILDNVKARIRSDPTLGTGQGGAVFQGGQGQRDITIRRDLPRRDQGKVLSWQVVEFTVDEIVQA